MDFDYCQILYTTRYCFNIFAVSSNEVLLKPMMHRLIGKDEEMDRQRCVDWFISAVCYIMMQTHFSAEIK